MQRKPGRPRLPDAKQVFSTRLRPGHHDAVTSIAVKLGTTQTEAIARAIEVLAEQVGVTIDA